jgi:hypothetical protein
VVLHKYPQVGQRVEVLEILLKEGYKAKQIGG